MFRMMKQLLADTVIYTYSKLSYGTFYSNYN